MGTEAQKEPPFHLGKSQPLLRFDWTKCLGRLIGLALLQRGLLAYLCGTVGVPGWEPEGAGAAVGGGGPSSVPLSLCSSGQVPSPGITSPWGSQASKSGPQESGLKAMMLPFGISDSDR